MANLEFTIGDNVIEVTIGTVGTGIAFKTDKFTGDGSETDFTCTKVPIPGSLLVLRNGVPQEADGEDYSLSGAVVSHNVAPEDGDKLEHKYAYNIQTALSHYEEQRDAFAGNNVTTRFDFSETRVAGSVKVFLNGLLKQPTIDYTEDSTGVNMVTAPLTGDLLETIYDKIA